MDTIGYLRREIRDFSKKISEGLARNRYVSLMVYPTRTNLHAAILFYYVWKDKAEGIKLDIGVESPIIEEREKMNITIKSENHESTLLTISDGEKRNSTLKTPLPPTLTALLLVEEMTLLTNEQKALALAGILQEKTHYSNLEETIELLGKFSEIIDLKITKKFVPIFFREKMPIEDSIRYTMRPYIPGLSGESDRKIHEEIEQTGIKKGKTLLEQDQQALKNLLNTIYKKISDLSRKSVDKKILVSTLLLTKNTNQEYDLRELATAIDFNIETSPLSLLSAYHHSDSRILLYNYYKNIEFLGKIIEKSFSPRYLIKNKNTIKYIELTEDIQLHTIPITLISEILEFYGLVAEKDVFAIKQGEKFITSIFELYRKKRTNLIEKTRRRSLVLLELTV